MKEDNCGKMFPSSIYMERHGEIGMKNTLKHSHPNLSSRLWTSRKAWDCLNPLSGSKRNIVENEAGDLSIVDLTYEAVTHGDLHGDNLLIDSRKNAWVIDFERSGEGHVLQDFIELESDILNRLEAGEIISYLMPK